MFVCLRVGQVKTALLVWTEDIRSLFVYVVAAAVAFVNLVFVVAERTIFAEILLLQLDQVKFSCNLLLNLQLWWLIV